MLTLNLSSEVQAQGRGRGAQTSPHTLLTLLWEERGSCSPNVGHNQPHRLLVGCGDSEI